MRVACGEPGLKSKKAAARRRTPRFCCGLLFADLIDVVAGRTAAYCGCVPDGLYENRAQQAAPLRTPVSIAVDGAITPFERSGEGNCNGWRTEVRRYNVKTYSKSLQRQNLLEGCPVRPELYGTHWPLPFRSALPNVRVNRSVERFTGSTSTAAFG
ncbi:MAG: hypothetical protein WAL95_13115 [Candidatus Acidiferrales bacterium]